MPETKPADFAFEIHYGLGGGKNAVNTFSHTVTKDLIVAGTATIKDFSFTEKEKRKIYSKMREANVMAEKYLDYEEGCRQVPYKTYGMKVRVHGKTQKFHWSNERCGMTEAGQKLADVISFIHQLVVEKDSYRRLPEPVGGYD